MSILKAMQLFRYEFVFIIICKAILSKDFMCYRALIYSSETSARKYKVFVKSSVQVDRAELPGVAVVD